jgi:capsular polysaccharide biosynthesis protein
VAAEGCVFVQRLLYVPDLSGGAWNPHPALLDAFDTIRHRALGGLPATQPWRRLYISRTDSGNRKLINEADVIGRAERAGFSVVLLSTLSVAEQVRLFAEASHILAPHGAGLTNIGFCQPGAVLCELHMDSYVHWAFRRLAALRGVRYGCLIGTIVGDRGSEVHGNVWRLDLGALDALLSDSRFIS